MDPPFPIPSEALHSHANFDKRWKMKLYRNLTSTMTALTLGACATATKLPPGHPTSVSAIEDHNRRLGYATPHDNIAVIARETNRRWAQNRGSFYAGDYEDRLEEIESKIEWQQLMAESERETERMYEDMRLDEIESRQEEIERQERSHDHDDQYQAIAVT
jgi:hypothetical protein